MIPYPSIETVYKRDPSTNSLILGSLRQAEVALVGGFDLTEKVDGTNIRLIFTEAGLDVRGRTDRAQFKPSQVEFLKGLADVEQAKECLRHPNKPDWNVTIYGELYGPGIQKGGVYRPDLGFRAFDILYGGTAWGSRANLLDVAAYLGIATVPLVGHLISLNHLPQSRQEMDRLIGYSSVAFLENGRKSERAEGFVAKPPLTLLNARGERVMFKLTYRDLPEAREVAA